MKRIGRFSQAVKKPVEKVGRPYAHVVVAACGWTRSQRRGLGCEGQTADGKRCPDVGLCKHIN